MSGPSASAAPADQSMVEGVIASIADSTLVIDRGAGVSAKVLVQDNTLVLGRREAALASISPGEALGVAAIRESDGSLTATVINVFSPELWQRVRKGQFPMASGQVMTNAEVDRVVDRVEGRKLFLKYEMLSAAIDVPADAVIRRAVPLKLADLKVGMKVSLRLAASTDGSMRAAIISTDLPPA
jgi:hypothetical protein